MYSRAEFAELLGTVTQHYSETAGDPSQPDGFGGIDQRGTQGVPMLALEAGLSGSSPRRPISPDGRVFV